MLRKDDDPVFYIIYYIEKYVSRTVMAYQCPSKGRDALRYPRQVSPRFSLPCRDAQRDALHRLHLFKGDSSGGGGGGRDVQCRSRPTHSFPRGGKENYRSWPGNIY